MTLLEALANKSETPCTIISDTCKGYQFRWYNGHIQIRTPTGKWHRTVNMSMYLLENAEIDDAEIL